MSKIIPETMFSPSTEPFEILNSFKTKNNELVELGNFVRQKNILKILDTFAAIFGIASIAVQFFFNDYLYYKLYGSYSSDFLCGDRDLDNFIIDDTSNTFCYLSGALTFILLCFLVSRYYILNNLTILRQESFDTEPGNFTLIPNLMFELIICSVFLPPHINLSFSGEMLGNNYLYHIGEIILIFMLLRIYLVLRLYEHFSKWTSSKAKNICRSYSTVSNAYFAIKCDLKERPFITIFTFFTILIITLGIAVMVAERSVAASRNLDMGQLTNNEWLIFVTMGTIGYGDIFPVTHHGRLFCIVACIGGMILVSALIVSLNQASELNKEQQVAYLSIKKRQKEDVWIGSAADTVKMAFRCAKAKCSIIRHFKQMLLLKEKAFYFRKITQLFRTMNVTSTEMLSELQKELEIKFQAANKVVIEVPQLKERCAVMKQIQMDFEPKLERILEQQKIIFNFANLKLAQYFKNIDLS
ncbi:hypothetical protein SteCoe_14262 [Stentor coeruleus]|uniref:Potassium channel domain-containing protein n=1 Tax=Stentor coeruleus TaxID=5963 RepID=A0A1R2C6E9_9CILI|nr:hypothetical protein SteCoe_14262 [Stentor coeruleus]